MVFLADRHDFIKLCRSSVQMNHNYGFGIRMLFKCLAECLRIHIPGVLFGINKYRCSLFIYNRIAGCIKGKARCEYNISLSNA